MEEGNLEGNIPIVKDKGTNHSDNSPLRGNTPKKTSHGGNDESTGNGNKNNRIFTKEGRKMPGIKKLPHMLKAEVKENRRCAGKDAQNNGNDNVTGVMRDFGIEERGPGKTSPLLLRFAFHNRYTEKNTPIFARY